MSEETADRRPFGGMHHLMVDAARTIAPARGHKDGPLPPLLLLLTFMTGVLDAVSYLALGAVFVSVMTGNLVLLGFAAAGAPELSVATSVLALGSFLLGAAAAGLLFRSSAGNRGHLLGMAAVVEGCLIVAALVFNATVGEAAALYFLIFLLSVAMGIQNAAVGKLSVPELKTTVFTLVLTGLASDPASGKTSRTGRRVVAVLALVLGALVGGWLTLQVSVTAALILCLGLVVIAAVAALVMARAGASWVDVDPDPS